MLSEIDYKNDPQPVVVEKINSLIRAVNRLSEERPEYLGVKEASKVIKYSPKKIRELCQSGELTNYGQGKKYLVKMQDLEKFLKPVKTIEHKAAAAVLGFKFK